MQSVVIGQEPRENLSSFIHKSSVQHRNSNVTVRTFHSSSVSMFKSLLRPGPELLFRRSRAQTVTLPSSLGQFGVRHFCDGKPNGDKNEPSQEQAEKTESTPKSLEEINADLENQIKEMRLKVLRAYADEENVRRIAKRDVENARVYANTKFAKSLLDVADNLERALAASTSETSSDKKAFELLVEGVAMTHTQLKKVFESHGVVKYGEVGDQFDPTIHDALFNMPDPSKNSGTIGQILKAGYKLHDRVIRPAEVGTVTNPE